MYVILLALILLGALLALVGAVAATLAWLKFRRARLALQTQLSEDVARLAGRTGEMEERLATLDARAQQLPVRVSDLQQNLTDLRILTGALSVSLRQAQRALSYTELKTFSANSLTRFLKTHTK